LRALVSVLLFFIFFLSYYIEVTHVMLILALTIALDLASFLLCCQDYTLELGG
jgi:hypothetical protein